MHEYDAVVLDEIGVMKALLPDESERIQSPTCEWLERYIWRSIVRFFRHEDEELGFETWVKISGRDEMTTHGDILYGEWVTGYRTGLVLTGSLAGCVGYWKDEEFVVRRPLFENGGAFDASEAIKTVPNMGLDEDIVHDFMQKFGKKPDVYVDVILFALGIMDYRVEESTFRQNVHSYWYEYMERVNGAGFRELMSGY